MKLKPKLGIYITSLFDLITNRAPAVSEGVQYELEDRGVLFIAQFPIIAAMYFLNRYSPFTSRGSAIFSIPLVVQIGIVLLLLYWFFFVYFFGMFSVSSGAVKWLDSVNPEEIIEEYSLEKRKEKRELLKSRLFFAALAAVMISGIVLYSQIGYGKAPETFLNEYKQQLGRLVELTADYNEFFGDYQTGQAKIYNHSGGAPTPEDRQKQILQAMDSLRNSYLYILNIEYSGGRTDMFVVDRWNNFYNIDWIPDGKGGGKWEYSNFESFLDKIFNGDMPTE